MGKQLSLLGSALLMVVWACAEGGSSSASGLSRSSDGAACDTLRRDVALFRQYAQQVSDALGTFNDIRVFERNSASGAWRLVSGWYVPVTIGGRKPDYYVHDMDSDRPMMLPTTVQSDTLGVDDDGQSMPYSSVGRMPGSNPEVQWIWVVRQYKIKDTTAADFPDSPDMAVIGHHPRTGASAYLQYYAPSCPKSGEVVVSPSSRNAAAFWSPMDSLIPSFRCERCHASGPFIHSPWINQVTLGGGDAPDAPPEEPVVPSDPVGAFFYVWSDSGQPFAGWDSALIASKGGGHFRKTGNKCTQCHRIAPTMLGLNQNSTRYAGLGRAGSNGLSVRSDSFQTPNYRALHWMPPIDPQQLDFYAGQKDLSDEDWQDAYGTSAAEVNALEADSGQNWRAAHARGEVADVPRPPKQYQTIVVDRPKLDSIPPDESLWIVDSRMRANTAGDLQQWRFFGKGDGGGGVQAAPVVYRRKQNDGSTIEFEVVFVGDPQTSANGGRWVSIQGRQTFQLRQGDYLGVVFTNTDDASRPAIIPYTDDDWAKLANPDGSTWLRDGSVSYRVATGGAPSLGTRVVFTDAAFRTYSFEFRNKL
jgi:hypothetical protein